MAFASFFLTGAARLKVLSTLRPAVVWWFFKRLAYLPFTCIQNDWHKRTKRTTHTSHFEFIDKYNKFESIFCVTDSVWETVSGWHRLVREHFGGWTAQNTLIHHTLVDWHQSTLWIVHNIQVRWLYVVHRHTVLVIITFFSIHWLY